MTEEKKPQQEPDAVGSELSGGLDREIAVGDFVRVDFHNANYTLTTRAEVLYVPCATGDSWRIRDAATGLIRYISEGCTFTKLTV